MRTACIAVALLLVAALGWALQGNPLIGAGVALVGGLLYGIGYLDGSAGR